MYKSANLEHKVLKNNEPAYLKELYIKPGNDITTRSTNDKTLLLIPRKSI